MTFDSFIKGIILPFEKEESLESVKSKLDKYSLQNISKEDQTYAIFSQGAEFLFDLNQLCLIQYEFGQLEKFTFERHFITRDTSFNEFKKYLTESNINFIEYFESQQKLLITSTDVKIYFDIVDDKFLTAINSW